MPESLSWQSCGKFLIVKFLRGFERLEDRGRKSFLKTFTNELLIFLIKILRSFGLTEAEVLRKPDVYVCKFWSE